MAKFSIFGSKRTLLVFSAFLLTSSGGLSATEALTSHEFNRNAASPRLMFSKFSQTEFGKVSETTRGNGADIFKKVFPSVVKVVTNAGQGSGVVISNDTNLILTNFHVIEGFSTVGVVFPNDADKSKLSLANVIKYDQIKDLALLSLNDQRYDLVPLPISEMRPDIGSDVHAIGHPLGEDWTYTRGYISQFRDNYSWATDVSAHHVADVVQTQTPINPGNSGGPLVNDEGELVGINTFGNTAAQGLNYSVAVSSIFDFFASEGNTQRTAMGENSEKFGKMLNSSDDNKNGNPDFYVFDYSKNAIADTYVLDDNEDLLADMVLLDDNENQIIELKIEYVEYEGKTIAIYSWDDNEDEVFETRGIDADMDGKLDHVEPIN